VLLEPSRRDYESDQGGGPAGPRRCKSNWQRDLLAAAPGLFARDKGTPNRERELEHQVSAPDPRRGSIACELTWLRYPSCMSTNADAVLKEAPQLSESDRARVAAELLASLDPDVEPRDSDAWILEVEHRAQAAIDDDPGLS
jgi:hypothetical protein